MQLIHALHGIRFESCELLASAEGFRVEDLSLAGQ